MESCQTLSLESFSYRWLVNIKPSLISLDSSLDSNDEASFIEMDPKLPPSKRFFKNSQDFKFDFPTSTESPIATVDADDLFSNGYLMPLMIDPLKVEPHSDHIEPTKTLHAASSKAPKLSTKTPFYCLKKYKGLLSRRFYLKYMDFLRSLCRRLLSFRLRAKREGRKIHMEQYCAEISPRISVFYPADDCRRYCDSESSIYEAVLHCKRSFGK